MAIEIVDLASYKMVIFHSFLYVYQAGYFYPLCLPYKFLVDIRLKVQISPWFLDSNLDYCSKGVMIQD